MTYKRITNYYTYLLPTYVVPILTIILGGTSHFMIITTITVVLETNAGDAWVYIIQRVIYTMGVRIWVKPHRAIRFCIFNSKVHNFSKAQSLFYLLDTSVSCSLKMCLVFRESCDLQPHPSRPQTVADVTAIFYSVQHTNHTVGVYSD